MWRGRRRWRQFFVGIDGGWTGDLALLGAFFWSAWSMGLVGFGLERSDGGGDSSSMVVRGGWRWIRE